MIYLYVLLFLAILARVGDVLSTFYVLRLGGVETNPALIFIGRIVGGVKTALVLSKVVAVAIFVAVCVLNGRGYPIQTGIYLVGVLALYVWIIVHNLKSAKK